MSVKNRIKKIEKELKCALDEEPNEQDLQILGMLFQNKNKEALKKIWKAEIKKHLTSLTDLIKQAYKNK